LVQCNDPRSVFASAQVITYSWGLFVRVFEQLVTMLTREPCVPDWS
jgi:hypothetical protein